MYYQEKWKTGWYQIPIISVATFIFNGPPCWSSKPYFGWSTIQPLAHKYRQSYGLYKDVKNNIGAIADSIIQANARGHQGVNQQFGAMARLDIVDQLNFHLNRFKNLRQLPGMRNFVRCIHKRTGLLDGARYRRFGGLARETSQALEAFFNDWIPESVQLMAIM